MEKSGNYSLQSQINQIYLTITHASRIPLQYARLHVCGVNNEESLKKK